MGNAPGNAATGGVANTGESPASNPVFTFGGSLDTSSTATSSKVKENSAKTPFPVDTADSIGPKSQQEIPVSMEQRGGECSGRDKVNRLGRQIAEKKSARILLRIGS